jgi:nitrite reductase (NO-forming)
MHAYSPFTPPRGGGQRLRGVFRALAAGVLAPAAAGGCFGLGDEATVEIHAADVVGGTPLVQVERAGRYRIRLVNDGADELRLRFADGTTLAAPAGDTRTRRLIVPAGGLAFRRVDVGVAGVRGSIAVAPLARLARSNAAAALTAGGDRPAAGTAVPDANAPPPVRFDPVAPQPLQGRSHDLEMVVEEKPMTVAQGVVQRVWTFNGTVPGPVIRIRVGDTLHVHFKVGEGSRLPHSLDFHASEVPWNGQMVTIAPGQERDFRWVAHYAGVFMYHCISGPPVMHVANGMYGMMIVEPREGLPRVDREFAIVQNEWYLGAQGETVSYEKAAAAAPAPDFMAFNGVAGQYAGAPLKVASGERVRLFVLNVGPNLESSFHVVGMVFDQVTKEGFALVRGNRGGFGSQAVDLAPAQGAIIEMQAPADGLYPMVTHTFNFHDKGAMGMIQVGDGVPKPATPRLAQH